MTAPKPLPPCPICGAEPRAYWLGSGAMVYVVECYSVSRTVTHALSARHSHRAEAVRRWRRIAGGGR